MPKRLPSYHGFAQPHIACKGDSETASQHGISLPTSSGCHGILTLPVRALLSDSQPCAQRAGQNYLEFASVSRGRWPKQVSLSPSVEDTPSLTAGIPGRGPGLLSKSGLAASGSAPILSLSPAFAGASCSGDLERDLPLRAPRLLLPADSHFTFQIVHGCLTRCPCYGAPTIHSKCDSVICRTNLLCSVPAARVSISGAASQVWRLVRLLAGTGGTWGRKWSAARPWTSRLLASHALAAFLQDDSCPTHNCELG